MSEIVNLGVKEGSPWTEDLRTRFAAALERSRARAFAIRLAASKLLSTRQLEQRLVRRGVEASVARTIASDLAARGVLNDETFARVTADSQLRRKPVGRAVLIGKLRAKGVAEPLAKAATDRAIEEAQFDPSEAALAIARRKSPGLARLEPDKARRRLYALLARRGFEPGVCRRVVERVVTGTRIDPGTEAE